MRHAGPPIARIASAILVASAMLCCAPGAAGAYSLCLGAQEAGRGLAVPRCEAPTAGPRRKMRRWPDDELRRASPALSACHSTLPAGPRGDRAATLEREHDLLGKPLHTFFPTMLQA